jgi:hypothetical protein
MHDYADTRQAEESAQHVDPVGPLPVQDPSPSQRERDEDAAVRSVDPREVRIVSGGRLIRDPPPVIILVSLCILLRAAPLRGEILLPSALAWVHRQPVWERMAPAPSGNPMRIGKRPRNGTETSDFHEPYLPAPKDGRERLALALYRQARGVNDVGYECLGYFRVMNLAHASDLRTWLRRRPSA